MIILEITTEETDWVIGPSKEEIIEWYCEEIGCQEEELQIKEIPEELWESSKLINPDIYFNEDDENDEGDDDYNVVGSFASEAAEWTSGVKIIGTTAY